MTTIYFANSGELDIRAVTIMGVSVKQTDNPIGYFGTGLKYAIATLLRTRHRILITTGGKNYELKTQEEEIRGKKFSVVMMGKERLGFTTELGRDWEVWQAFRELYSNAKDEFEWSVTDYPVENETVIRVQGEEIVECFYNRSQIFLERKPDINLGSVEVHDVPSNYLFYRGVRVFKLPKSTAFTYNFTRSLTLTEDRTLKSIYEASYYLSRSLPMMNDSDFCGRLMKYGDWENSSLDYTDCSDPSKVFLDTVESMAHSAHLQGSALALLKKKRADAEIMKPAQLSSLQERDIEIALTILRKLDVDMQRIDFEVVSSLGSSVMGMVRDHKIYISMRCVAQGPNYIAITLYEEWIHKNLGYDDETRAMQQHLFDKILELVTR